MEIQCNWQWISRWVSRFSSSIWTRCRLNQVSFFKKRCSRKEEGLLEKKIKIREDKKRPINFSYFLAGATRLNELFIIISNFF
ncbi:hypothetical protein CYV31_09530 [Carnobacterium maltaromaticum]|nr:hypothetical protein CYV31_09530 [Carnobacterium maltaromaticum]